MDITNKDIGKEVLNNQKVIMRALRTIASKKYNDNDNSKLDYDLLEYRIDKTGEFLRTLEGENNERSEQNISILQRISNNLE